MEDVEENEIKNILKRLNIHKSVGADSIRPKELRENADIIAPVVTNLINKSLSQGKMPNRLKQSIVRLIFKNGSKRDMSNYGPISILPVIEKVMKEVVAKRLKSFIEKFQLIEKNQYGFRAGKNIHLLLANFSHYVNKSLSRNSHVLA